MIRINTDELERLSEVFIKLGTDVEDALGKTTLLRNEMLDDTEFMANPQSEGIITTLDWAINSLIGINEDINYVETLFQKAKNDFTDNENELVKAIEAINNKLDSIRSQLDSTIASNQVVVVDHSEELRPVNEVEKLVAGSVTDLELTNISALSELAKKETEVTEINDKT